jgi:hypothetical protein
LPDSTAYKVKFGSGEHYDEEKVDLLEHRRVLLGELTSARANIGHLEKDLNQTQSELSVVGMCSQILNILLKM